MAIDESDLLPEDQRTKIIEMLESIESRCTHQCEVSRYKFEAVDVKGDGHMEYIVTLPEDKYCGSGGCSTAFFMKLRGRWITVVEHFGWTEVQESRTNGVRDILLGYKHYGEGGPELRGHHLAWTGTEP